MPSSEECLLNGNELYTRFYFSCLLQEQFPVLARKHSRVPIPKKVPGETRPLTILHDANAFLLSVVAYWFADASIKAGDDALKLVAYKHGKGIEDIALPHVAAREDAIEFEKKLALSEADIEKFYCRINPPLQCTALAVKGCPKQGYIVFKADNLNNRRMTIRV